MAWDAVKVLLGLLDTLLDGNRNLVGLAVADAYNFTLVTNYDEGCEGEPTTSLDYLCHTVDLNHALCEVKAVGGNCSLIADH